MKDHSSETFYGEGRTTMLKEIFSGEGLSSLQKEMDWNLPPIYDEYIEDGLLILRDQHIKNNKAINVTNEVKIDRVLEKIALFNSLSIDDLLCSEHLSGNLEFVFCSKKLSLLIFH